MMMMMMSGSCNRVCLFVELWRWRSGAVNKRSCPGQEVDVSEAPTRRAVMDKINYTENSSVLTLKPGCVRLVGLLRWALGLLRTGTHLRQQHSQSRETDRAPAACLCRRQPPGGRSDRSSSVVWADVSLTMHFSQAAGSVSVYGPLWLSVYSFKQFTSTSLWFHWPKLTLTLLQLWISISAGREGFALADLQRGCAASSHVWWRRNKSFSIKKKGLSVLLLLHLYSTF